MRKVHGVLICIVAIFMVVGCTGRESLDEQLQSAIDMHQITVVDPGPTPEEAKVVLGQMLFFDKEISGNRDIACATCRASL